MSIYWLTIPFVGWTSFIYFVFAFNAKFLFSSSSFHRVERKRLIRDSLRCVMLSPHASHMFFSLAKGKWCYVMLSLTMYIVHCFYLHQCVPWKWWWIIRNSFSQNSWLSEWAFNGWNLVGHILLSEHFLLRFFFSLARSNRSPLLQFRCNAYGEFIDIALENIL